MVAARTRTSTSIGLLLPSFVNSRVLQHVQQLGLQRRLHLADFVEEDRAGVRLLELADARRRRAGERALLVAEQLALEQLGRQRRAIDLDERLGPCAVERWWMARATSSLPTPLSPRISTVTSLSATRSTIERDRAASPGCRPRPMNASVLVVAQLPAQIARPP